MTGVSNDRALWLARHVLPHEPMVRAALRNWKLPGDLDPDDVVQECYSRFAAMESVEQIRNPRAYFFSVARTIILMHLRHSRVVSIRAISEIEIGSLPADEPSPETQVSDREQLHRLALAIAELPEPGRKAFLMRVVDERSHREIGDALGMSGNAVQKSIAKTLLGLMSALGRGGKPAAGASKQTQKQRSRKLNVRTRNERRD